MTIDVLGISALITAGGATLALIIKSVQQSRCTHIRCCGVECDRDIKEEEN